MFLGPQSMIESSWIMGMATMKRVKNRRGSALPNAKKMYEEAQMVRRVKSYLSNIKVIYDEDKLREMSYQCEPDTKGVCGEREREGRERFYLLLCIFNRVLYCYGGYYFSTES